MDATTAFVSAFDLLYTQGMIKRVAEFDAFSEKDTERNVLKTSINLNEIPEDRNSEKRASDRPVALLRYFGCL